MDGIDQLEPWIRDMAARLAPRQRRTLARAVAVELRKRDAQRIKANQTPDGTAMVARKKRPEDIRGKRKRAKRSVKARKMFMRASGPRYLKRQPTDSEASVGFVGAMARIMNVHHYGQRDSVSRTPGSPQATYPARPLLGFPEADRQAIMDIVLTHLE